MVHYDPITVARVVPIEESMPIPDDFIEMLHLNVENPNALLVFATSTQVMRIIPTKSNSVIKVAIEIDKLSPDFLRDLGHIFLKFQIMSIYTTGLCFSEDNCVYEGYFDTGEISAQLTPLEKKLQELTGVSKVTITAVTKSN